MSLSLHGEVQFRVNDHRAPSEMNEEWKVVGSNLYLGHGRDMAAHIVRMRADIHPFVAHAPEREGELRREYAQARGSVWDYLTPFASPEQKIDEFERVTYLMAAEAKQWMYRCRRSQMYMLPLAVEMMFHVNTSEFQYQPLERLPPLNLITRLIVALHD